MSDNIESDEFENTAVSTDKSSERSKRGIPFYYTYYFTGFHCGLKCLMVNCRDRNNGCGGGRGGGGALLLILTPPPLPVY